MSELLKNRIKRNLTQEELAVKSSISVRTIQRIETGTQPKGYTLKALAKALEVSEDQLVTEPKEEINIDTQLLKYINLSSLVFTLLPPLNIVAPLLLAYYKKERDPLVKQIASIQILWVILSSVIFMLSSFMKNWFALGSKFILVVMVVLVLSNVFIIIRNGAQIDKKGMLFIKLNFILI